MNSKSSSNIPNQPRLPVKAKIFRFLYKLSGRRSSVDHFLTPLLKYRHFLPVVNASEAIPDFETTEIRITTLPHGPWATPLIDTLTILKAVVGCKPRKILEIGSYKGVTALNIAANTPEAVKIYALDRDAGHGEAYTNSPLGRKITRLIGPCDHSILSPHAPFDFIFVDADHDYNSVIRHSLVAMEVLDSHGVILWHDYRHDSFLHGGCAVAEALDTIARARNVRINALEGTTLAIYSRRPDAVRTG